jgi:hypothetical protein
MPIQTVTTRSDGSGHVTLCSCGWEGPARQDKSECYRDKAHHQREHEEAKP